MGVRVAALDGVRMAQLATVADAARAVMALGIAKAEGELDYWAEYTDKWDVLETALDALDNE